MMRRKSALFDVGLVAVIAYLVVHTITGRHGLVSHVRLQEHERALSAELAELQARRSALELEVRRLRPSSLDWDYVEERARRFLHMARPDEALVPLAAW